MFIIIIIIFLKGCNFVPRASPSGGGGAVGKAPPPNEGEALRTRLRSEGEGIVTVLARHYSLPCLPKLEVPNQKVRRKQCEKHKQAHCLKLLT